MSSSLETNITSILNNSEAGFQRIARNQKLVRWAEESQFALQSYHRNTKLQQCVPQTIQDAIINVAAVGLSLNPALQYAYLVPQSVKVGDKYQNHCQLRISFQGLIKVVTDSGIAEWAVADVVKKSDKFSFNGKWSKPEHIMEPFGERGESVGVYCTIKLTSGDYLTEVADWSEVLKAKAAAATTYVWDSWPDEMAKKFIVKRASKQWPKTDAAERVNNTVDVINATEGSDFQKYDKIEEVAGYLIEHIAADQPDLVLEAYDELDEQERKMIWTAKTKGGFLSQDEKKYIKAAAHGRFKENNDLAAEQ